ncbi:MAG: type-F conjugative transfer system secretin TraK [Rubrivivax sp.]
MPTSTDPGAALRALAVLGFALAGGFAQAAQTLTIRDGDTTVARISIQDQTRLRVASGRVLEVIGDVYDADRNPGGRLVVLRDESAGEVYLKPSGETRGTPARPIKLDVKTDRGTVALLLQPADSIGETLTLDIGNRLRNAEPDARVKAPGHLRALKAMTLALANPELSPELAAQIAPLRREVQLWSEARFVLTGRLEQPSMVGETYELTNISTAPMVLAERELYADGVLAVAIERHQLPPGATTRVWVLRSPVRDR